MIFIKRFSIIMPAYNVSDYIEDSINSVLNQNFSDYELIIVDDCSTDNGKTLEKINKFSEKATIIQNFQNLGAGGARNTGIKKATGEYILFLDTDDILYNENVLSNLDKLISNNTPDIVYLGFKVVGTRDFEILPTEDICTKQYQLAENKYINAWSKCWNREFLIKNEIVFPEKVIYEDVPFAFHGISKSNSYIIYNGITHVYTSGRNGSNASKNQFKQSRDTVTCIEELSKLKDKINQNDLNYLLARIEEQKARLIVRMNRVLTDIFNINF